MADPTPLLKDGRTNRLVHQQTKILDIVDKVENMRPPTRCSTIFQCPCLASGVPDKSQDPFKYSSTEFHEPFHSLSSKHGWRTIKIIDEFGAMLIMMPPLLGTTIGVVIGFWTMVSGDLNAMTLAKFANNIIEWTIVLGAWLMWFTMCYWSAYAHWFWKLKVWPLPSLMPGGFMPRLAAFSLGILMFVTSTLVSEGRVKGSDLGAKFQSDHWDYCRATDMEADDVSGMWFSRLLRRPPAISEGFTCFGARFNALGQSVVTEFNSTDLLDSTGEERASIAFPSMTNVLTNVSIGQIDTLPASAGFPLDKIESLGIFNESDFPQINFHCMYQCVKWKTVGLMSLIKNVGSIVAGSAVVVKTSDGISKAFGGHFFAWCGSKGCRIGLPLITQDTPAEVMKEVLQLTTSRPGKGRSKLFAAFACVMAMSPLRFASKLDIDGYYTVDYYVTAVFLSSLLVALVVRQWNPYKMMRIAYTDKMWLNGQDMFIDFKKHNHRSIDLYEWIHLTQEARASHLIGCARMVTVKAVQQELEGQKLIPGQEKDIEKNRKALTDDGELEKSNKKLTESKNKLEESQLEDTGDTNPNVMKDEYHNKYANLMVKTIKAIAVITTSPPVTGLGTDDSWGCSKGSILYKNVVLREGAIGTIVDKVDDTHIKVRFPKEKPTNAPILTPTHLFGDEAGSERWGEEPQYTMEFQPALQKEHQLKVSYWMRMAEKKLLKRLKKPDEPGEEEMGSGAADEEDKEELLNKFEDVVVPLEQVIEAAAGWRDMEKDKSDWDRFYQHEQRVARHKKEKMSEEEAKAKALEDEDGEIADRIKVNAATTARIKKNEEDAAATT